MSPIVLALLIFAAVTACVLLCRHLDDKDRS